MRLSITTVHRQLKFPMTESLPSGAVRALHPRSIFFAKVELLVGAISSTNFIYCYYIAFFRDNMVVKEQESGLLK